MAPKWLLLAWAILPANAYNPAPNPDQRGFLGVLTEQARPVQLVPGNTPNASSSETGYRGASADTNTLYSIRTLVIIGTVCAAGVALAMWSARSSSAARLVEVSSAIGLCLLYITISSGLISFNKYLLSPGRFPHPLLLTAFHMTMTSILSCGFYTIAPSWYPNMPGALANRFLVFKYVGALSVLFACSLFLSNSAYLYASVAFLQFIKESNLTIVFALSCVFGLQFFSWKKLAIIAWIIAGCTMCITGELHFQVTGLIMQVTALFCECTKNVMLEVLLKGSDLKFDALTLTFFQAPLTLVPLLIGLSVERPHGVIDACKANWYLLLPNSMIAFILNITLAVVIQKLSATTFVLSGLIKDIMIVVGSVILFGDAIAGQQIVGFAVTIAGISYWSYNKIMENPVRKGN